VATICNRVASRGGSGYTHWSVPQLHRVFAAETPRIGTWVDSSGQTPEQTVDAILERQAPP
jgi:hypothetical protein